VLAFVNLSGNPTQEYFSDGLTEEPLNELAQIPELRVAARTSSFAGAPCGAGTGGGRLRVGLDGGG
jgi:TolB-like protein